jgi:hypothetical protein
MLNLTGWGFLPYPFFNIMIYIKDKTAIIPKNISGTMFTLEVTSPFGTTTIFNDS